MNKNPVITCVGEVLWDALPGGIYLGGAPLNVCLNLNRLGAEARMVSRVGEDRLGSEAKDRIERGGLDSDFIQVDKEHETGFVKVQLNSDGDPEYVIMQPVAWDFINLQQKKIVELLENSWAVVYGTLAHRQNHGLRNLSELSCLKVLDMNLRAPHFVKDTVMELVKGADILKMNLDELELLKSWYSISGGTEKALREIAARCNCLTICVTRGGDGAVMLHKRQWFEHGGYPVTVMDAVGAGDAFLAALLYGLSVDRNQEELLPLANAAGAYVASQSGANPEYSISDLDSVIEGKLLLQ